MPPQKVWYLEAALGFAAFIAAIFFMVFVSAFGAISEFRWVWILLGLLFIGMSLTTFRVTAHRFLGYMALALSLGGLGMVLVGWAILSDSHGQMVIANGVTCLFLIAFRNQLLRFLWLSVFLGNVLAWLAVDTQIFSLPIYVLLTTATTVYFFSSPHAGAFQRPLAYALALSAACASGFSLVPIDVWHDNPQIQWWIVNLGVMTVLAAFMWRIRPRAKQSLLWPSAALAVMTIIAWLTTPSILIALTLMIVAYANRESWLFGISVVAFSLSIWFYYYYLDVSLLHKSLLLSTAGSVLLLARFVLLRRGATSEI